MKPQAEASMRELLVRRARELGKTLKTVAVEAGLARSCLYKLINGTTRDPSVQTLLRLAGAVEVSPIALLRLYGDMNTPRSERATEPLPPSRAVGLLDSRDIALLNADVTVPHHAVVNGGEIFEKIWEIQNIGEICWTGRRLVRVDNPCSGIVGRSAEDPVAKSRLQLVSLEREIAIPKTLPGGLVRLRTFFSAPKANCCVASVWRIEDQSLRPCYGPAFFLGVTVTVIDQ
ncbi:NBR1-Ig-like domain-containing protein [uncultured Variovorax sp.]|uniref:NBR1-Ig-like domain-containing protein n=1 Tax=uncultured Variovorax sp. TaxID=114708 RepID=UPI0025FE2F7E|nr:NBR1-Ig-like domain-containing protein [uncultured Variovorax sp.]